MRSGQRSILTPARGPRLARFLAAKNFLAIYLYVARCINQQLYAPVIGHVFYLNPHLTVYYEFLSGVSSNAQHGKPSICAAIARVDFSPRKLAFAPIAPRWRVVNL